MLKHADGIDRIKGFVEAAIVFQSDIGIETGEAFLTKLCLLARDGHT